MSWLLEQMLVTINWILTLGTVVGGPLIGSWALEKAKGEGLDKSSAITSGVVTGLVATIVIVLASYGAWAVFGIPAAWGWITRF